MGRTARAVASEPGYRRPVLIVQSDDFNRSRIRTVIAVVLTTKLRLAGAPGNVPVSKEDTKLSRAPWQTCRRLSRSTRRFLRSGSAG